MNPERKIFQRQVTASFQGKTIQSVDASCTNSWIFHFSDGTYAVIETEYFHHNIYGLAVCETGFGPKKFEPAEPPPVPALA